MGEPVFREKGATLVELIVTIVIIAIALVSLTMTLSFSAQHSADSMYQVKVVELGQAYIEEILTKRYDESTPVGGVPACSAATTVCGAVGAEGEARSEYDDVDDYDGLSDNPPRDSLGDVRANYIGYQVDVSVAYVSASQIATYSLDNASDGKMILVTVSPPSGTPIEFSVYRGNF